MWQWLAARWRSITRKDGFYPRERRVLLALAVLRAALTASFALALWTLETTQGWPLLIRIAMLAPNASLAALVSADFIEHLLRKWILGYDYNPYVSPIGELEGWNGPVNSLNDGDKEAVEVWNHMKCGPPPGGPVNPILPWWGNPSSGSFCK